MNNHLITSYDSVSDLLPDSGWLGDYVKFTDGLEACPRFRFFCAACALGALMNNRVWIQRGDEGLLPRLFPNIWIILLAPPGRGHKTSTINMALNCLTEAAPEVRLLSDKLTPESLVQALSSPKGEKQKFRIGPTDATGLIKAPELSVFFGKQQYNTGLVSLITDLYDWRKEWSSETIMRGKSVLKNICLSILGGSTPHWLQKMLPEDAFTGGFMSRFVLVEMPPTYFKRIADPKKLSPQGWDSLVDNLRELLNLEGEMIWDPKGRDYYREYYESLLPTGEIQQDAYQEREAEQILKLGMLLSLSQGRMILDEKSIIHARQILRSLMVETTPRIEHLTTHPRMQLVQDITDLLRKFRVLSQRDLLKKLYRSLSGGEAQFHEALRILKASGDIVVSGTYRNEIYRLKDPSDPEEVANDTR